MRRNFLRKKKNKAQGNKENKWEGRNVEKKKIHRRMRRRDCSGENSVESVESISNKVNSLETKVNRLGPGRSSVIFLLLFIFEVFPSSKKVGRCQDWYFSFKENLI